MLTNVLITLSHWCEKGPQNIIVHQKNQGVANYQKIKIWYLRKIFCACKYTLQGGILTGANVLGDCGKAPDFFGKS